MRQKRPEKLTDAQLFLLVESKVADGEYAFTGHSRERQEERFISDIEVLDILEGKRERRRNKKKDSYDSVWQNWKYCIEGFNSDSKRIRIIVAFDSGLMPIITVMWI
ncbi:MAG: DUF4258 domain-containing protein [Pseudomonadota bacterium]